MTMYDASLGKLGVENIDALFSKEPFSVRDGEHGGRLAGYNHNGKCFDFLVYDPGSVTVCYGLIKGLPEQVQSQIYSGLKSITLLDQILMNHR